MPLDAHLWGKREILVAFKNSHYLKKWGKSEDKIIEWTRKWKHNSEQNYIPQFRLAKGNEKPSVVIELNGKSV